MAAGDVTPSDWSGNGGDAGGWSTVAAATADDQHTRTHVRTDAHT